MTIRFMFFFLSLKTNKIILTYFFKNYFLFYFIFLKLFLENKYQIVLTVLKYIFLFF